MKIYCDYHGTTPAQWNCEHCATNYCGACITRRAVERYGRKETLHFCPKCDGAADRLAIANMVVPFWNRLPQFFLYPLHPQPLILIVVLAAVSVFFADPGLFNNLMGIAIGAVLIKYSHAALIKTARGSFTPPPLDAETLSRDFQMVFKQLAIFIIVVLMTVQIVRVAAEQLGPTAAIGVGILCLVLVVLAVPAMIIVLVATKSLLHAVNPAIWGGMVWRIGWGYLLMYLFLGILGAAPTLLARLIIAHLPAASHVFLFNVAKCFYTIISYHLMGYVMLQYHEEVGYEVDVEEEGFFLEKEKAVGGADTQVLHRVDIFVKEGKIDDAIALIKGETSDDISKLDLAERYFKLLKIKQLVPEMLKHGRRYLDLLAEAKDKAKLREVYAACVAADPAFTPGSVAAFKIAGCFDEVGQPHEAVQVYNRFIKAYPKDPRLPKAYFLAAGIINERLRNPKKAAGVLKALLKSYPNHELAPHIRKYLKQIEAAG
jgi:hypothetical protein